MSKEVQAEICLYGTSQIGAGWLVSYPGSPSVGDHEPKAYRSFTLAIFQACDLLWEKGQTGSAWVYEPSGHRRALVDITSPAAFGSLKWEPAPVLTISCA